MTYAIPLCVCCGVAEVQIVVNSVGSGYCSPRCEHEVMAEVFAEEDREDGRGVYEITTN